jgi:hypothetical protein
MKELRFEELAFRMFVHKAGARLRQMERFGCSPEKIARESLNAAYDIAGHYKKNRQRTTPRKPLSSLTT